MKSWRLTTSTCVMIVHGARATALRIARAVARALNQQVRIGAEDARARTGAVRSKRRPATKATKRGRPTRRRNPAIAAPELDAAVRTHRKWNGFDPERITPIMAKGSRTIPRTLVPLGELVEVAYSSDKFDGKRREYVHRTKQPRPLLCTDPHGKQVYIVGGRMKVTSRGLVD